MKRDALPSWERRGEYSYGGEAVVQDNDAALPCEGVSVAGCCGSITVVAAAAPAPIASSAAAYGP